MGAKTDRRNGSVADMALDTVLFGDATAPTLAEINSGTSTRFECDMVDMPDTPRSGSTIDIGGLCDMESSEIAGVITNGVITGEGFRHFPDTPAADPFFDLFDDTVQPAPSKQLWVCRGGCTGAAGIGAVGDRVDVYTVQVAYRTPMGAPKGDSQRFEFGLAVLDAEIDVAVVA